MQSVDLQDVLTLARQGNLIPVVRELRSDLDTPVSVYLKLRELGPAFLLESVEGGHQFARYSFIGVAPRAILSCRGRQLTRQEGGRTTVQTLPAGQDPLHVVQAELARYTPVALPELPRFIGGLVGYLGYDTVRFFEPRLEPLIGEPGPDALPEAIFMLSDTVVAFDHARSRLLVIANAYLEGVDPQTAYQDALARIGDVARRLAGPLPVVRRLPPSTHTPLTSNFAEEEFCAIVERAKEYIAAGDIFQVVLSQSLSQRTSAEAFDIYRALRHLNPSPYLFFFDFGMQGGVPYYVMGASPEILVRLEGRQATVRPIAGTRPRGRTPAEDQALEQELLADPKERAEHIMLVDLGRNDIGRVCDYGTITVPTLFAVERYSHVMHLTSQVEGRLRAGLDACDLLRASFPAGTVSGAPKVRAMEIIHELEGLRRGLYAGAVGYFSYDGAMDTCIAIRTMQMLGNRVTIRAGAGIVADSDPHKEYVETLNKAKALAVAVEEAEVRA